MQLVHPQIRSPLQLDQQLRGQGQPLRILHLHLISLVLLREHYHSKLNELRQDFDQG